MSRASCIQRVFALSGRGGSVLVPVWKIGLYPVQSNWSVFQYPLVVYGRVCAGELRTNAFDTRHERKRTCVGTHVRHEQPLALHNQASSFVR